MNQELLKKYSELKKKYGQVYTNVMGYDEEEAGEIEVLFNEEGYAHIVTNAGRKSMYFVASSWDGFRDLVNSAPRGTVLNYVYKENGKNEFLPLAEHVNLKKIATYRRKTIQYKENPYLVKDSSRRGILHSMYDSSLGEYPTLEDIPELDRLYRSVFDIRCDGVFSHQKWMDLINNHQIRIYRENGIISAVYVFRYDGKKLYSNISINIGAANTLYSLERQVFEEAWKKGIRIFYGWGNMSNTRAHNHFFSDDVLQKCTKSIGYLFYDTFLIE